MERVLQRSNHGADTGSLSVGEHAPMVWIRQQNRSLTIALVKKATHALLVLLAAAATPLPAAELVTLGNAVLVEAEMNDGDSFKVSAGGRELHLRLYYVDCPETTFASAAELERIRDQQHHFGLEDPHDVVRFGERAADYVEGVLAEPFSIHTSYAWAPGRSATGRYYAFVETQDGHDLGSLLVGEGLARVHGKTRPAPDGRSSRRVLEELEDLRALAMLSRSGIWEATNPNLLIEMRRSRRMAAEELDEFKEKVTGARSRDDAPLDLNRASDEHLQRIPGIGPVTAAKIVAGRPYRKVEDLLKIPGIGPKKLEAIAPYVTLGAE